MPTYCFRCDTCGKKDERIAPIDNRPQIECCGKLMYRDYNSELCNTGGHEYKQPLHSDSLAITPSQVNEHREKFPGIELDKECRPVFHNVSEHDAYLNKIGMYKAPQRTNR